MSILDGFVPENGGDGTIFISVTNYGMTFSKASVEVLGSPRYVKVFFDRKGKRIAIVPCAEENGARSFARDPEASRSGFVRWNDKRLMAQIVSMGDLSIESHGVRVLGEYIPEENLLVYNLKQTIPLRQKNG